MERCRCGREAAYKVRVMLMVDGRFDHERLQYKCQPCADRLRVTRRGTIRLPGLAYALTCRFEVEHLAFAA